MSFAGWGEICLEAAFGLVAGYVAASVSESYCHRAVGHASKASQTRWRRWPRLLGWLHPFYWSHAVIHHGRTFKEDFVTQFRGREEQLQLDDELSDAQRQTAHATQYGLTILVRSFFSFMAPPSIVLLPLIFVGNWAVAAALAALFLPPLLSFFIHPLIHRPYGNVVQGGGLLARLMQTSYMRHVIRHHWLHHRYPSCNFNLLILGDYLLRTHRAPTEEDVREMQRQGIPLD